MVTRQGQADDAGSMSSCTLPWRVALLAHFTGANPCNKGTTQYLACQGTFSKTDYSNASKNNKSEYLLSSYILLRTVASALHMLLNLPQQLSGVGIPAEHTEHKGSQQHGLRGGRAVQLGSRTL